MKANRKEFDKQADQASAGRYVPGAIAGGLRQFFGNISAKEVQFRRAVLDVQDMILRARSGANINEQEFKRMVAAFFSIYDEPTVFVPAMRRFLTEVGATIEDTLKLETTPASELLRQRGKGRFEIK